MKNIYFLFLLMFAVATAGHAQTVTIPDANFKTKLLSASASNTVAKDVNGTAMVIDTDGDGQIQLIEALLVYELNLNYANISSMSGIQSFTNLRTLTCFDNLISTLNVTACTYLTSLDCSNNGFLTNLNVTGLSNLITLNCSYTKLAFLNLTNLSGLVDLNCSHALITQITFFNVPALKTINCSYNNITALNFTAATAVTTIDCSHISNVATLNVTGLNNLVTLDCSSCNINTVAITNLSALKILQCSNSHIVNLNLSNLPSLENLFCQINGIVTPNLTNLPAITWINCSENSFVSLDFTNLPSLKTINCHADYDLVSFNFSALPNLTVLDISDTGIEIANLTNLTKLQYLTCYTSNTFSVSELMSLDVSGLQFIKSIDCHSTSITTLDLGAASLLTSLNISYTGSLVSLNIKNHSSALSSNFVHVLTALKFICADEAEIAAITATYDATFHPLINTYCNIPSGGTYNTVDGIVKFDYNGNGCDSLDIPVSGAKFTTSESSPYYFNTTYSDEMGRFNLYSYGSISLTATMNNSYFTISPTSTVLNFNPIGSTQTVNFCVTPVGVHNDLQISMYPFLRPRPGFTSSIAIVYKNKGNTTQSGTVNLNFEDDYLNYISSSLPVSNQIPNIISWNFTDLKPFESRVIKVTFLANTPTDPTYPLNSGDALDYTASIVTSQTDETPANNSYQLTSDVVNSFDPNDKVVLEGSQIDISKKGDYLHYLVNFQNTGTASAVNVVVKDIINSSLDLSTLEMETSSHACKLLVNNSNKKVEFFFNNINLPGATVNEPNSHGYIAFKIKPIASVGLGSVMPNTANIYFDYNAPIVTNTVTTTIVALATQDFDFGTYFSLYPNPAKQVLNIETKTAVEVKSIEIYNLLGQMMIAIPSAESVSVIDVANLKTGTYFIKLNTDKGTANTKFIKN